MHVFYDEKNGDYRVIGFIERGIDLSDDVRGRRRKRKMYTLTIETRGVALRREDDGKEREITTEVYAVTYSFRGRNIHVISDVSGLAEGELKKKFGGKDSHSLEFHLGKFLRAFVDPELLRKTNERSPMYEGDDDGQ